MTELSIPKNFKLHPSRCGWCLHLVAALEMTE